MGEPAWSASGRVLALSSLGRTDCCTVYAPLGSSMRLGSNIQTNRIRTFNRAMGSALAGSQNDVHTEGPKLRIILSHASRSMTSYSTWSREYLGERQRTARLYPVWTNECFDALRARQATWRHSRLLDMAALRLLVAVGALATAHGALELTEDNWDSALAGKSAFVKFLAPW